MFNKFSIFFFIFINISLDLHADEKQLIIDKLINVFNITFDFEQMTNNKKEVGMCILVFNNKLKCNYKDSYQKEILINGKTLVVRQKRYNKENIYPISNSPFLKIFNKNNLINLIKNSDYRLSDNIELIYVDENKEKIIILFEKNKYDLVGWKIVDQLQNKINFSIRIKDVNSEIDLKIFKISSAN